MTENRDINYRFAGKYPSNMTSAKVIVPLLCEAIHPESVIDFGCGIGIWLSEFKRNGVDMIQGIDGEWVLESQLLVEKENIEIYDFEDVDREIRAIENNHYDLAVCLEMAEHVSANREDYIVDILVRAADIIYFSGATPCSGGMHHVNEQWQSHWIKKFEARGFVPIDYIRPKIWKNNKVCYFYAEESFIFVKQERIDEFPLLKKEIRDNVIWDMVHPVHFRDQVIKSTHNWDYLIDMQRKLLRAYSSKIKFECKKIRKNRRNRT